MCHIEKEGGVLVCFCGNGTTVGYWCPRTWGLCSGDKKCRVPSLIPMRYCLCSEKVFSGEGSLLKTDDRWADQRA